MLIKFLKNMQVSLKYTSFSLFLASRIAILVHNTQRKYYQQSHFNDKCEESTNKREKLSSVHNYLTQIPECLAFHQKSGRFSHHEIHEGIAPMHLSEHPLWEQVTTASNEKRSDTILPSRWLTADWRVFCQRPQVCSLRMSFIWIFLARLACVCNCSAKLLLSDVFRERIEQTPTPSPVLFHHL